MSHTTPTTRAASKPLAVAALAAVGVALFGCGKQGSSAEPTTIEPSATEQLLREVRCCWNPRSRKRLIGGAPARVKGLGRGLAAVLADPAHPLLVEAVLVAGSIGNRELVAPLRMLWDGKTGPGNLRAALARSIEHLQPWSPRDLEALLADPDLAVQLAAVEICAGRGDRPITAILELLGASDAGLRRAARDCLTADVSPQVRTRLLGFARAVSGRARVGAILALEGHVDKEVADFLLVLLRGDDPHVRAAALASLESARMSLPNQQELEDIIFAGDRRVAERALAARCLEHSDALAEVTRASLEAANVDDPGLDYCIARVLIRHGSWNGVERLLGLLEEHEPTSDESVGTALIETRHMLGRLSGVGAEAGVETYRTWAAFPRRLGKPRLPRSGMSYLWVHDLH